MSIISSVGHLAKQSNFLLVSEASSHKRLQPIAKSVEIFVKFPITLISVEMNGFLWCSIGAKKINVNKSVVLKVQ